MLTLILLDNYVYAHKLQKQPYKFKGNQLNKFGLIKIGVNSLLHRKPQCPGFG